ncbi:MAG TPA: AFG1/ZapE family ATPase, partial [Agromyces sp.]
IWHHTFEPGIELIKAHMQVWNLDGPIDYRTVASGAGHGFASGVWTIAPPAPAPEAHRRIAVSDREFDVVSASGDELTATFDQLCVAPTSTIEFLEWSRRYRRWTITGIPAFSDADPEAQQRFINLVDVLVDSDVSVVFSSHVGLRRFLTDASQRPDAFRMSSRLQLLRTRPSPESQKDNGKRLPSLPSRYRVHAR